QISGPACPVCGAPMRQRQGKHGAFWSCTRYPECKGVLPVEVKAGPASKSRKPRRSTPKR
ncbi:MAG: topoisomerase DNA-binding C4 zinc finger domain-containing protein, partial [Pseudomonas sp.]